MFCLLLKITIFLTLYYRFICTLNDSTKSVLNKAVDFNNNQDFLNINLYMNFFLLESKSLHL